MHWLAGSIVLILFILCNRLALSEYTRWNDERLRARRCAGNSHVKYSQLLIQLLGTTFGSCKRCIGLHFYFPSTIILQLFTSGKNHRCFFHPRSFFCVRKSVRLPAMTNILLFYSWLNVHLSIHRCKQICGCKFFHTASIVTFFTITIPFYGR